MPAWVAGAARLASAVVLGLAATGRTVLAVGGNEGAARSMGPPVDRAVFLVYAGSGALGGPTGVPPMAQIVLVLQARLMARPAPAS